MKKKILFVYAPAGPPLDYCLPKISERCEVITCIVSKPSPYNKTVLVRYSKEIHDLTVMSHDQVFDNVRKILVDSGAESILTFSEFILREVAEIAVEFGMRGVGHNVDYARNKILMRQRWAECSLPQPKFVAINNTNDLSRVIDELRTPFIIKVAYGAGSIGQQVVKDIKEFDSAISRLMEAVKKARNLGKHEHTELKGFPKLIAEEIINSSTDSWYETEGFGDYLSVEGIVKDGQYYPIAMTGRLPTIEPFTEVCNFAPCILNIEKKTRIVEIVTKAINALGLENAATHTELKLMANGELSLLETSARMGGVAIACELEIAFAVDYVDLFIRTLIGEDFEIPKFESTPTGNAAASVAMIAVDTQGCPWLGERIFEPEKVDWSGLTESEGQVTIQWSQSVSSGSDFPPYSTADGVMNYAGQALVVSDSAAKLKRSVYRILDNLQYYMPSK